MIIEGWLNIWLTNNLFYCDFLSIYFITLSNNGGKIALYVITVLIKLLTTFKYRNNNVYLSYYVKNIKMDKLDNLLFFLSLYLFVYHW